jgi:hypothetical protein
VSHTPHPEVFALAPWGHSGVPSGHCVRIGVGFACGVQVAHPRSLGEPVGELGV